MATYLLNISGPPRLLKMDCNNETKPLPLSPADIAVIALIGLQAGHGAISRGRLAEILWPDTAPEKSASRLSSAMWRLRRSLDLDGAGVISDAAGGLSLGPDVKMDIGTIRDAADRLTTRDPADWAPRDIAHLQTAMEQITGVFLDGLEGDWVAGARQDCAETYERALELLVCAHGRQGNVGQSISAARSLVREDPYREDIHAVLLDLYGRKGQRMQALAHYAKCCAVLKQDLGVDPGDRLNASLHAAINPVNGHDTADLCRKIEKLDRAVAHLAQQVDGLRASLAPEPPRKSPNPIKARLVLG